MDFDRSRRKTRCESGREEEVNWSELTWDVLDLIMKRLTIPADRDKFSVVCRNWSSVFQSDTNYFSSKPPWLMLAMKSDDSRLRGFIGLAATAFASSSADFELELPQARAAHCVGSTGCWLVMNKPAGDGDTYLLNPFTGVKIDLPPLIDVNPEKVVLSFPKFKSPVEDFVAVAIIDGTLAYTRRGAKSWKFADIYGTLLDVSFHQGKIYAIKYGGDVFEFVFSIDGKLTLEGKCVTKNEWEKIPRNGTFQCERRYLVEFQGMLLQVLKVGMDMFDVFRFNFRNGQWIELNDLGLHSLFVGYNTCVSLLASADSTFRPNCIYFTIDPQDGYFLPPFRIDCAMGVFNLVNRTIEPHYTGPCSMSSFSPPIWVIPTSLYHS